MERADRYVYVGDIRRRTDGNGVCIRQGIEHSTQRAVRSRPERRENHDGWCVAKAMGVDGTCRGCHRKCELL